jgi:hypothetical protein
MGASPAADARAREEKVTQISLLFRHRGLTCGQFELLGKGKGTFGHDWSA